MPRGKRPDPKEVEYIPPKRPGDYYMRKGFDLTANNLEQEREIKENKTLVERLRRAGRYSHNPLMKAFMQEPDINVSYRCSCCYYY